MAFHDGWGNVTGGNAMTATAEPFWDVAARTPKMRVMNFSLLDDSRGREEYSKEEFLEGVWAKAVRSVDSLGDR